MRPKYRVFLSYAHEDTEAVEVLYQRLIEAGFLPWMDTKDLLPGQPWARTIESAIRRSDFFLACLSSRSVTKPGHLQRELRIGLEMLDEFLDEDIYLIPLRLDDCEVPEKLRSLQWVSWFEEDGWARLNRALRSGARAEREVRASDLSALRGAPDFEPETVLVTAGEFAMGSAQDQVERLVKEGLDPEWVDWEQPQHRVRLSGFSIGKYPVTKAEYQFFIDESDYQMPLAWTEHQYADGKQDHPVTGVSWHDARTYCEWLGEKTSKPYRLPSEAEWEKAARGADGRLYPWGNDWDPGLLNNLEGGRGDTSPVGFYSPYGDSPCGVADMAGNVWEWCQDWFDPTLYRHRLSNQTHNPIGPIKGKYRMLKGGAFHRSRLEVRCAVRVRRKPELRDHLVGFRVVLGNIP